MDQSDANDSRRPGDDGPAPSASPAPGAGAGADDPDQEWVQYQAWVDREIAAGRGPEPDPWVEDDGPLDPLALEPDAGELPGAAGPSSWWSSPPDPRTSRPFPSRPQSPDPQSPDPQSPDPYPSGSWSPPWPPPPPYSGQATPLPGQGRVPPVGPGFAAARPTGAAAGMPLFAQGGEGDRLPPGPVLAGLTDSVTADPSSLSGLTDDELVGVLRAARRQVAREQYKQALMVAEFGRRRQAAFNDAARRGIPVGCRPGGFPGEELACEMVTTPIDAGHRIDDAIDLTSRLPRTLAGMAAGLIDEDRAGWIAYYTRSLTDQDAAYADEILAEVAPGLRVDQLARKAAALEKKLNPQAVKARRERARLNDQRVEARRELSGNASLSGREMDTADVMASKAY